MPSTFEQTGWSRIDITPSALDSVEADLKQQGIAVESYDLSAQFAGYTAHMQLPEYSGEYRVYGGIDYHCLLEKSLEHYLSLALAVPRIGQVAVDIGSCQSVMPGIIRRLYGIRCYEQDLEYTKGVHGDRIGSSADAIPLPDGSVDFMTLHCTFEHFEGHADTGFVKECARLLKPGGRTIILPLYLNANHCNVTGETNTVYRKDIAFDTEAQYFCEVPEWKNRFGRHYSPAALLQRVIQPAHACGLAQRLLRCENWKSIDPRLWLRWILVIEKPRR
jgi:SAM-dependent methyltransferase